MKPESIYAMEAKGLTGSKLAKTRRIFRRE
jgi:hypothetical protein